jgi:hypothetical protein
MRLSYGEPNIEFSCPAASAQHFMEMPGGIGCSGRRLRGQLQRFVMKPRSLTIMAVLGSAPRENAPEPGTARAPSSGSLDSAPIPLRFPPE